MLNGDNQGNGKKSIVLISPPSPHKKTNLVNTYLICDSPLQRSARRASLRNRSGMIFVAAQKLYPVWCAHRDTQCIEKRCRSDTVND